MCGPCREPAHVKIYKVCIYVIVWESSVFPWLLEGLTAELTPRNPTSRSSSSWTQQEKDFCCHKTPPPQPPASPLSLHSERRRDTEEADILLLMSDCIQSRFDKVHNPQTLCWDHSAAVAHWPPQWNKAFKRAKMPELTLADFPGWLYKSEEVVYASLGSCFVFQPASTPLETWRIVLFGIIPCQARLQSPLVNTSGGKMSWWLLASSHLRSPAWSAGLNRREDSRGIKKKMHINLRQTF